MAICFTLMALANEEKIQVCMFFFFANKKIYLNTLAPIDCRGENFTKQIDTAFWWVLQVNYSAHYFCQILLLFKKNL